jgi:hypothetical protein
MYEEPSPADGGSKEPPPEGGPPPVTDEDANQEALVGAVLAELDSDEYVQMVDTQVGPDGPVQDTVAMVNVLLMDTPKRPEDFLCSHAGPSSLRVQGFPLVAKEPCVLTPKAQTTVPVMFEEAAVRPATDYIIEATPQRLSAKGLVSAKTLIDGTKQDALVPIINTLATRTHVERGTVLAWAFPVDPDDQVYPSTDRHGKWDVMPLREPPKVMRKQRKGKALRMVNSMAVEDQDEGSVEQPKVGTDPTLEVPSSDDEANEEDRADFLKYQVKEPTLRRKQK